MIIDKSEKDIEKEKYLHLLYKVMMQVGQEIGPVIVRTKSNDPSSVDINERNYVIYLSYILGKIEGESPNKTLLETDYINGEIYKQIRSLANDDAKGAYEKFVNLEKRKERKCNVSPKDYVNVRPDFVIHQSHKNDYETEGQKLIIEAKATNDLDKVDFCWDFLKLNVYIEEFKFDNAIYMLINTTKEQIKEILK